MNEEQHLSWTQYYRLWEQLAPFSLLPHLRNHPRGGLFNWQISDVSLTHPV